MAGRPVVLAAIAGAHGVRGDVRLKLFTASPDALFRYGPLSASRNPPAADSSAADSPAADTLTLESIRPAPGGAIARFRELSNRSEAEARRGQLLSVPRQRLPALAEGEYYWHDLIGRAVHTPDGQFFGTVTNVANYGASDVLELTTPAGRSVLVPLIAAAVPVLSDPLLIDQAWLS